ncbi:PadR family transcriptional regulator [Micromonospora lupini]|uniref:PadR family transcriptional regulator n=1 Tax=Micromonospora lupini TaxID=285679 RepID=UPI0022574B05|nr:helix-turn-helix transcriptional regulator [Micromonospora lupini]MCX5068089.1 PadR family transcriptional regulator [Micromonospora lupini]
MAKASLHESTYLILTALVEAPRHGCAVLDEVRRISDGRVDLRAGTLYAALDRLRTEGLIDVERDCACSRSSSRWASRCCSRGWVSEPPGRTSNGPVTTVCSARSPGRSGRRWCWRPCCSSRWPWRSCTTASVRTPA